MAITEREVAEAAAQGIRCPNAFGELTGAGTRCGTCVEELAHRLGRPAPCTSVPGACARE
jgi:bacterioferritin-associated ferredoxin